MSRALTAALVVWIVAVLVSLAAAISLATRPPEPVCHSVTEDSVITDCDYRDGGWYPKS